MAMEIVLKTGELELTSTEEERVRHQLASLERRLIHHPAPQAMLHIVAHRAQRQMEVDLRVQLEPHGIALISHQTAETADRAVRLAVEDVERQLERRHAEQRGEPAYGVVSRREPRSLRPAPPPPEESLEESAEGEQMD